MRTVPALLLSFAFTSLGNAQLVGQRATVRASGEGVVAIMPDQVRVSVGITSTGATAEEAASENADRVTAVLAALRSLLGTTASIRTIGYSISPSYRFPQGGAPVLIGYTANNTVEVTTGDLSASGKIIDTAAKSGATTVSGISFSLRNTNPPRLEALRLATQQARTQAEAIAQGIGGRIGTVLAADEASVTRPRTGGTSGIASPIQTPTPIEIGLLEVRATVVIEAELLGQ